MGRGVSSAQGDGLRVLIQASGFQSPTELASWFLECGVEPHDTRMEQAADGTWRGSGYRSPEAADADE